VTNAPLSIAIFGNTNNYPLLLAEGLRTLGHNVRLIISRKDLLHRPEAKYPEWEDAYPPWMQDCSDITDEDLAYMTPAVDQVIHHLTHGIDLAILNDAGLALAEYLASPHVALLTGSDLAYYADFKSLQMRSSMWDPGFKRSLPGRRNLRRMADFVARQRDGIAGAAVVCYGHRGLVPEGDRLLDELGVSDDQRVMLHLANVHGLAVRPAPQREKLRVLCGSRIVFLHDRHPSLSLMDFKGTDVLLRGFAAYCKEGGKGELRLPQKGQDWQAARELVLTLGISSQVTWLPDMPLAKFYEEMADADLLCDQFGTSYPGMVTADAYCLGRPVMANFRNEIFCQLAQPMPGFNANTPSEVAKHLLRIESEPALLEEMSRRGRMFAETYMAPERLAQQLLDRCL
jgi:glycosyltransferase involved in cell wall biosynthesis